MSIRQGVVTSWQRFNYRIQLLTPLADLAARLMIADVFFFSGLLKVTHWDTTLLLFSQEYSVPFLPSEWAAVLGSGVEFIAPIFLVLGLGGRIPAVILFLFNIVAVASYPFLWTEAGRMGLMNHFCWGASLMMLMCYGPSKITLDYVALKIFKM